MLLLLLVFQPPASSQPAVALAMIWLANIINHPHFAHSYQIFYRGFGQKAFGPHYDPVLRLRYIFAGVVAPLALLAYLLGAVLLNDVRALGLTANLMLFLVGWHYVKQGYGMLIVCSVLKRQFFADLEKRVLLINAYVVWAADWLIANWVLSERDFWGLAYYSFDVPGWLVTLAVAVSIGTTAATLWMLVRKWATENRRLPINGVVAYLVTLYAWLLFNLDPFYVLVIPACHSLQYLVVVWRYQLNAERDRAAQARAVKESAAPAAARFAAFLGAGLLLGILGFWGLPIALEHAVPVDQTVFGPSLFFFMAWVFINIHHYLLDNVMWRRGNPDTGRYLFAHR
ncbi:hypothetical protein [Pelagibius sp.]|uniref:hypothetical protein n=1 Tax=Pelagibius sp. TaxID=1931238 RepID=UPI003B502601